MADLDFIGLRTSQGPGRLTSEGESGLVNGSLGTLENFWIERLRKGLLMRFPQQDPSGTPAPDDALAAMGRDRRIVRGVNESSEAYAARLVKYIDTWKTAGNPYALMGQFAAYLGPGPSFRTVDVRGNWYSRAADGTQSVVLKQANWDWDGAVDALTRWARFWVIVYPNDIWSTGSTWGDGHTWGDGRTWGSTATADQISTLRTIVRQWKPAGTRCVNIIIAFDASSFNPATARDGTGLPDGTWGQPAKIVNGVYVPARLSTARFVDGS